MTSLLKIARLGHPTIRENSVTVSPDQLASSAVQQFIDQLVETMRDAHGVGIAAPQVHVSQQIIAVEVLPDNPRYPNQVPVPLTVVVNPKIVEHDDRTDEQWEGCLSVPDLRGRVSRWLSVKVEGLNRKGQPVTLEARGFFARVLQHEIDHLHGYVFLDRLLDLKTLTHLREYELYWKK
ncbi:peptide deformylase [Candidatus Nitronereus thalassa]|uniref:Peptide deformylase n=1 Tax=Candidatus Nitronereus thalassa TaxID=3020898 RepID=A0ABU3K4L9_9BACT|nr:peptide deformylase [Candidatus Nitronereus thalassa]MDT7041336.1 peptide deformylase [Candidatus Nitronereus thalassa]